MAKVGYIFAADTLESLEQDKTWMNDYGCIRIVEEKAENEKSRPEWRTLLMALERGDEIVISKFSNALRGARELSFFLELCRIKVVRIISIHDKVDSKDEVFPPLSSEAFLNIFGSLPHSTEGIFSYHEAPSCKSQDEVNKVTPRERGNHCQHVQWRSRHR